MIAMMKGNYEEFSDLDMDEYGNDTAVTPQQQYHISPNHGSITILLGSHFSQSSLFTSLSTGLASPLSDTSHLPNLFRYMHIIYTQIKKSRNNLFTMQLLATEWSETSNHQQVHFQ